MVQIERSLNGDHGAIGSFSKHESRVILIAGLTCACVSVLATLITLRWFILMKRTFRHQLIMFLIFSDTFKALWYFVSPVVIFSRGPEPNSSGFCQASGFFLAVGIEASDFAILMVALHAILYIFHPPARSGDSGGLYRWRKLVYPLWIAWPILAASLAFVNDSNAYTSAGTYCYLPRRPFWYRLALSWIPRYFILSLILSMYVAVYIYVQVKFRSFSNLANSGSSSDSTASESRRSSISIDDEIAPDESSPPQTTEQTKKSRFSRPAFSRSASHNFDGEQARTHDPWDDVTFITSKPLRHSGIKQQGVEASDFATSESPLFVNASPFSPTKHEPDQLDPAQCSSRKTSNCPTDHTQLTGETISQPPTEQLRPKSWQHPTPPAQPQRDPLLRTRKAIRKQLRYLFIYPAVYVLMWLFPFVSHCLLYNDYYVSHPVYWLQIMTTCSVSLQAAADCLVFSWREKPWRRMPEKHRLSLEKIKLPFSQRHQSGMAGSAIPSIAVDGHSSQDTGRFGSHMLASGQTSRATSTHWWEAEGKKRKDSVWMGTDSNPESAGARRETVAQLNIPNQTVHEEEEEESGPSTQSSPKFDVEKGIVK